MKVLAFFFIFFFFWTSLSFALRFIICAFIPDKGIRKIRFNFFSAFLCVLGEYASIIAAIILIPAGLISSRIKSPHESDVEKRAVLLVHGYVHNSGMLLPMKWWLKSKGIKGVFDINLHPPFSSIEHFTDQLSDRINELRAAGWKNVVLAGHSMGGLVSRYYAATAGGTPFVEKIITIASPHFGTAIAVLGPGECCRQMQRRSAFLNALNKNIYADIKVVSLWSKSDNIIIPPENSIAPFSENIAFDYLGHIVMVFSPQVLNAVYALVENK